MDYTLTKEQEQQRRLIEEFVCGDAAIEAARRVTRKAVYLRDRGLAFNVIASMAKLLVTDIAMKVTTDAVKSSAAMG